jgi:hypothetical protein
VDVIYKITEGKGITGKLCNGKPCTEGKAEGSVTAASSTQ